LGEKNNEGTSLIKGVILPEMMKNGMRVKKRENDERRKR
jgi:hypothetical protein